MTINPGWPAALTSDCAGDYLGVSPRTRDKLQAASEIIPVEIAGAKRFRKSDLDEILVTRPDWQKRGGAVDG